MLGAEFGQKVRNLRVGQQLNASPHFLGHSLTAPAMAHATHQQHSVVPGSVEAAEYRLESLSSANLGDSFQKCAILNIRPNWSNVLFDPFDRSVMGECRLIVSTFGPSRRLYFLYPNARVFGPDSQSPVFSLLLMVLTSYLLTKRKS